MCFRIVGFIVHVIPLLYTILQYLHTAFLLSHFLMMHICCYHLCTVGVLPSTIVSATVLSSHHIQITWSPSPSDNVTGYLISYASTVPFTSCENEAVNGSSTTSHALTNLEEGTVYTITVQSITTDNRVSANSNEVTIMTYAASK